MLSVVIPSYNHKAYVLKNVPKIRKHLDKLKIPYEIIVVDDGSEDGTYEACAGLGCKRLRNSRNMGKGFSLRKGILAARGDHILMTDSDLAAPIENLSRLWKERQHDLVFGSRRVDGAHVEKLTIRRRALGGAYHLFLRCMLRLPIQDTQCGFKLFSKDVKPLVSMCKLNGFAFDTELTYLAKKRGYSMKEVGISWEAKPDSRVIVWKHPAQMFIEVCAILRNDAKGVYSK